MERLLQKRHADPVEESPAAADRDAQGLDRRRRPDAGLHHFSEQRQVHRHDADRLLRQSRGRPIDEGRFLVRHVRRHPGQTPQSLTEADEHPACVVNGKGIDRGIVAPLLDRSLHGLHEAIGGQAEVVANEHDRLHAAAVAVPQRRHQLRGGRIGVRLEPLLELVEDDDNLAPG